MNETDVKAQQKLENAVGLHQLGRLPEAEAVYREILAEHPDNPVVHNNLGIALLAQKRVDDAIEHLKTALQISPDYLEAHNNLGNALRQNGDHEMAKMAFEHALEVNPEFIQALGNLGNTLMELGEFKEAVAAYDRAIKIKPDVPELYYNRGRVLYEQGRMDDAEDAFRQTLKLNASYPLAHWNLSHVLLMTGRFGEAWPEYEWRWQCPGFTTSIPELGKPRWDGSSLQGRTILVFAEQGFGDTIQFARFLPELAAMSANVVLLCQPDLKELLLQVDGVQEVTSDVANLPNFDVHSPMMSLPLMLGTELDSIPADIPYIPVPDGDAPAIIDVDGVRVGLAWAGRGTHALEQQRSLQVDALAPLSEISGITLFALHDDDRRAELATAGLTDDVVDLSADLKDFAATARVVAGLDLVITVDTAVAHLAGAMGRPVWILLPHVPDWRWMIDRDDSPWYPTMRLFRQPQPGDWDTVVQEVAHALAEFQPEE